jgi:uncharacterized repeat protein (TIGR03803 family)
MHSTRTTSFMALAAVMIRGAVMVAALCVLVLVAARPVWAQTETVMWDFCDGIGCPDGENPGSGLTSDGAGNFYGTTIYGGANAAGTVFELSPNGSGGWNETVLYNFCSLVSCTDGQSPFFSNVLYSGGNLYGTAQLGGAKGFGVVFELTPAGAGWNESVLYSFCPEGSPCSTSSGNPAYGLVMDSGGNLYGTTTFGGSNKNGGVFELSKTGSTWTERLIYKGTTEISYDFGPLTLSGGNIFGTVGSSSSDSSMVFELTPNGKGWKSNAVISFKGTGTGPSGAQYGLAVDTAGNVYGTSYYGGKSNFGTVYELSPGTTKWTEKILYSFKGGTKDGREPAAGVVLDSDGNIYGTTFYGGTLNDGTVFELVAPVGEGAYKEKLLWNFNQTDGYEPTGNSLILYGSDLYGTATWTGGTNGYGVAFEVTP